MNHPRLDPRSRRPHEMMRGRGRASHVADERVRRVLPQELRGPDNAAQVHDLQLAGEAKPVVGSYPIEERRPESLRLGLAPSP